MADNGQTLGEILEDALREPPKRDSWEEYAVEKVQSHISGEQFFLEDQNGYCWAYGFVAILFIGGAIYQGSKPGSDGLWEIISGAAGVLVLIACAVVRVYNGYLWRRLGRQGKQIERFGLRYLL